MPPPPSTAFHFIPVSKSAHDVRQLRPCALCGGLGHREAMLDGPVHGRCFIEAHGLAALLALPAAQTGRLRLGDISYEAARALLDARSATAESTC